MTANRDEGVTAMIQRKHLAVLASALTVIAGCSSSEADPIAPAAAPPPPPAPTAAGPRPMIPLGSLDEACDETALTGRALLDSLESSYSGTLQFENDKTTAPTFEIRLTYEGGPLTCHPRWGGLGRERPEMVASLDVDVRMTLKTSDGLFDETFVATLTREDYNAHARLRGRLRTGELRGTYAPALETGSVIRIDATLDSKSSGNVSENRNGRSIIVAYWRTIP